MARKVTIPAKNIDESISSVEISFQDKSVRVRLSRLKEESVFDSDGAESKIRVHDYSFRAEYITIDKDYYSALMSGHPKWSPKKPEGMFGRSEIWKSVDAIRSGVSLQIGVETDISKDRL